MTALPDHIARPPMKFIRLELLMVLISGMLKFVVMDSLKMRAFYIAGICILWILYVLFRYPSDHTLLVRWGFIRKNFFISCLYLLPSVIVSLLLCLISGRVNQTALLNWHVLAVLALYPLWGLIQQFMMVGVFAGNLTMQTRFQLNNFQVILFTSFLFGMVHYPNLILMLCTFAMQLLFTSVYLRWRNLWALGVMHGLIGTLLMFCMLQRDPWEELFVWF